MDFQQLLGSLGSHPGLMDAANKAGLDPSQAQGVLQGVLEHVNAGGALENAASAVAAKTGIDPAQIQQFLPHLSGLLQSHAEAASSESGGVLGGLGGLGGLLGKFLPH